jgi:DNA mismatch endonuclease (patch repair protein)
MELLKAERMDIVNQARRSAMMGGIQGKNTRPEMLVRKVAHALGFRFRLHRRELPGSPDLVFPRLKKVIFVHGCFWHRHEGCRYAYNPKSNADFWQDKFQKNKERDCRSLSDLAKHGWNAIVIWECETRDVKILRARIAQHLGGKSVRW